MYYYGNQMPLQQGWICPRCGRVNAPSILTCNCSSGYVIGTATNSPDVWVYKGNGKCEKAVPPHTHDIPTSQVDCIKVKFEKVREE